MIALLVGPCATRVDLPIECLARGSAVLRPALGMPLGRAEDGAPTLPLPTDEPEDWTAAADMLQRTWRRQVGRLRIGPLLALAAKYDMPSVEDAVCVYGMYPMADEGPTEPARVAAWARAARDNGQHSALFSCRALLQAQLARYGTLGDTAVQVLAVAQEMGWTCMLRTAAKAAVAASEGELPVAQVAGMGREALVACLCEMAALARAQKRGLNTCKQP